MHPMHECQRRLTDKSGPDLLLEDPDDLRMVRQWVKQVLQKAQADLPVLAKKFERGYMCSIDAHLTVTDDATTSELITRDTIFCDMHVDSQDLICQIGI